MMGQMNPHKIKGHKCDVNCYNNMTLQKEFPMVAQVQQQMHTTGKSGKKNKK